MNHGSTLSRRVPCLAGWRFSAHEGNSLGIGFTGSRPPSLHRMWGFGL